MSVWVNKLRGTAGKTGAAEGKTSVSSGAPRTASPFWVMVQKEFGDHIRSWRFVILLGIVTLACIGSLRRVARTPRRSSSVSMKSPRRTGLLLPTL